MSKNMLIFISKMALEYRLSLKNVCVLLGMEPTEENRINIYNQIIELTPERSQKRDSIKYLFNYETVNESDDVSKKSLNNALKFLRKYKEARKTNDKEKIKETIYLLQKTDKDFKHLKETKNFSKPFTEEEKEIILKYRIKYCVSNSTMANYLNVKRDRLSRGEKELENLYLKKKAITLSEFYEDVTKNKYRKR